MARIPWLERRIGSDWLARAHRELGTYLVAMVVTHALLACVLRYRVAQPVVLARRHRLPVHRVVQEADRVVSIYVSGRELERLGAEAGQFFRWRFLTRDGWWQAHPFSLSAAPTSRML